MTDAFIQQSQLTLGSLLRSGVRAARGSEIVTRGSLRLSYPDFAERVRRLGHALTKLGVTQGSTLAILDWDGHRYLEAYFAVPMLGATLMTVNIRLNPGQIGYTLDDSNATCIICSGDFITVLEEIRGDRAADWTLISIDAAVPDSLSAAHAGDYEALLADATGPFTFPDLSENTIATAFYTTGTTGLPKGVYYTHRQLVIHTLALSTALASADDRQSLRVGDVYLPLTPMFHVHAWGVPYVATMLGIKQVYAGRYEAKALVELKRREGVTFSHCVPTILQMILAAADSTELTGWKMMIGGAAMVPSLARAALRHQVEVFAAYGMSETCPFMAFGRMNPGDDPHDDAVLTSRCRVGQPPPLLELKLLTEAGEIIDPRDGETRGELVARAPWLTQGYLGKPEASAALWAGGYLHTNDVAVFDPDGALRIVDRLKDVIKTGGEWISSLDLESRIREHEHVIECAVIGIPHEKWGERPIAFVTKAATETPHEDIDAGIRALLQVHVETGKLSKFAIPDRIYFVAEIPKTSVGKLDKKRLREELKDRRG